MISGYIHGAHHKIGAGGRPYILIGDEWLRSTKDAEHVIKDIDQAAKAGNRAAEARAAEDQKLADRRERERERAAAYRAKMAAKGHKRTITAEQRAAANARNRRYYRARKLREEAAA